MPEPGAGIRADLEECKRIVCLAANTMTTSCAPRPGPPRTSTHTSNPPWLKPSPAGWVPSIGLGCPRTLRGTTRIWSWHGRRRLLFLAGQGPQIVERFRQRNEAGRVEAAEQVNKPLGRSQLGRLEIRVARGAEVLQPLTPARAADLLEVVEDRHGLRSTIITSQLPVGLWHEALGEPTLADAILDRLVHNAYRIDLRGDSLRRPETVGSGGDGASMATGGSSAEQPAAQTAQDAR
jgi:hypothetical protein